jgi:hypothetical protein
MFKASVVSASKNKWVTIILNVAALLVMVGNALLSQPIFPTTWTPYIAAAVAILNVVVEWLSKLEASDTQ